jgi:hypothetical protein
MENKKEVDISIVTRSTLLFAEGQRGYAEGHKWLILVHSVTSRGNDSYRVKSHMSYCLTTGSKYINPLTPGLWGLSDLYKFYEPTKEHKQMMLYILKKNNLKFISPLNKLVPVKND